MKSLIVTVLTAALTLAAVGDAAADSSLQVIGQGTVSAVADRAAFSLSLDEQDMDAASAQRRIESRTTTIIKAINSLAIADDSLRAASLSVNPQYRWTPDRQERLFDGYRVSRAVSFVLNDLQELGATYQTLIEAGADSVNPAQLSTSKEDALTKTALQRAYADAAAQAQTLATAAGMTLGAPQRINSVPQATAGSRPMLRMSAEASDTSGGIYEPGKLEISRQITVEFSLSP